MTPSPSPLRSRAGEPVVRRSCHAVRQEKYLGRGDIFGAFPPPKKPPCYDVWKGLSRAGKGDFCPRREEEPEGEVEQNTPRGGQNSPVRQDARSFPLV